jgi:hypothetical protein
LDHAAVLLLKDYVTSKKEKQLSVTSGSANLIGHKIARNLKEKRVAYHKFKLPNFIPPVRR